MRKQRGRGRPKLPAERVKKLTVSLSVTLAEHRAITKAAADDDLSVSLWLRRWVMEALRRKGG